MYQLFKKVCLIVLSLSMALALSNTSKAQQASPGDVELDLQLLPILTQAQVLYLAQLGIDTDGAGTRLFNLVIENTTNSSISDLFLHANIRASGVGLIVDLDQDEPFSLRPNQVVVANNNSLQTGIPGVPERTSSTAELTSEGEEFVNSLRGSTRLPNVIFTINVQIYQGGPRGAGTMLSETVAVLPIEGFFDDFDVFLIQPGDIVGSSAEPFAFPFPTFRWDGAPNQVYRIVVVEGVEGESPESLIQASLSTDPVLSVNIPSFIDLPLEVDGSLLEFEMADALVRGTSFDYPASGSVQPLMPDTKYYWQVFAVLSGPTGLQYQPSEIFEFKVSSSTASVGQGGQTSYIFQLLAQILTAEQIEMLRAGNFMLESINLENQVILGVDMERILEEFINRLDAGEIELRGN